MKHMCQNHLQQTCDVVIKPVRKKIYIYENGTQMFLGMIDVMLDILVDSGIYHTPLSLDSFILYKKLLFPWKEAAQEIFNMIRSSIR